MNALNVATLQQTDKVPQVSIGMPVYNGAKFIHEALDSLLAQTFTDFELIISDNASADETEVICREYAAKDARIRYVRQSKNLGASANFQFVLDEAMGEYFIWAAADDYIEPETALADLVTALLPTLNFAVLDVSVIYENGNATIQNIMHDLSNKTTCYEQAYASVIHNNYQIYSLFRINFLRDNFFYLQNKLPCYGESLFVHAISLTGTGVYVPSAIKIYRRHNKNASSIVPAYKLFVYFLEYSMSALNFFANTDLLTLREKSKIIAAMISIHTRYITYLAMAAVKQTIVKAGK